MFKKITAFTLIVVMALGTAACGKKEEVQTTESTQSGGTAVESASGDAEYTMSIASADGSDGIAHHGLQVFEEYVEAESEGRIDVIIYMDGILGGEREALEGMKLGSVQATSAGTASFSTYNEKISVVNLPFLFPDFASFVAAMEGDAGAALDEMLTEQKITPLGYFASGLRIIGNNVRPIHTVEDLKGIKMRVPEQDIFLEMFRAMGSNPTPMSWTEIYTGLQQGTIDGMECSPSAIYDSNLHEVQKYMTVSNHSIDTCIFAVSTTWFESLPEDLQQIILDGGKKAVDYMNENFDAESANVLKEFENSGIEVTYLTEEERAGFVDAVSTVYEKYGDIFGQDLIDSCLKYSN